MQNSIDRPADAHKATRRIWAGGIVAGLVVAALAGGARLARLGAAAGEGEKAKQAVPLEFVAAEVARPVLARMPLTIEFSGPLVAPRTAIVRAKAAGTLLALDVAEGSRVKAGQVIGADRPRRPAEPRRRRAALVESAQADAARGRAPAHRQRRPGGAELHLPDRAADLAGARSTRPARSSSRRRRSSSSSRVGIREATLVAPITGIVGKRHVVPGEKVSAEQQIVTIVDLATLELAGSVGTHEVSLLAPGQAACRSRSRGSATPVAGRIDRIAPAAEAGTRAIGVVVVARQQGRALPRRPVRAGAGRARRRRASG